MPIYVSPDGMQKLKDELARLDIDLKELRKDKSVAYTQSGDTWHDNPYFNKLQQDEDALVRKITEMRTTISNASVFVPEQRSVDNVRIGSIVRFSRTYEMTGERTDEVWEIVGFGETDVNKKRVAYNSPTGKALIGMASGDTKKDVLPKGPVEYEVVKLYPDWDSVP